MPMNLVVSEFFLSFSYEEKHNIVINYYYSIHGRDSMIAIAISSCFNN